jgi:predicted RND superfamily exporter protein
LLDVVWGNVVNLYANFVVRNRVLFLLFSLALTLFLGFQLKNLNVIVDADELLPKSHPFVQVTERVQNLFGNRFTVVIGITPKTGDVYTPETMAKVFKATQILANTPGVTPGNIQSLAAPRAKDISGNADGLVVARLMDHPPASLSEAQAIRARLSENPAYKDILVSKDGKTAAIYVEFRKDPEGFTAVMDKVQKAIAPIKDNSVRITVSGQPVFLGLTETYSSRMVWLLPMAILLIGVIHLEAFRTLQGLILPLVTAVLALIWSLGLMTMAGVHLDPFNNVTPILILAVAAGHAVQMLKRYYEEFDRLRDEEGVEPHEANRLAVIAAMVKVGPVMLIACGVACLSFFSLIWFDIQAVRTFGVMSGLGIASVVAVELTFTPALRAMLPPPPVSETDAERAITFWDRTTTFLAQQVETPKARRRIFLISAIVMAVLLAGATQIHVNNSVRSFFGDTVRENLDDQFLNRQMAGTNTFYVLVEGKADDAIKDPAVLKAMDKTQALLAANPQVGHTLSIVDMLKQINRGLNGGSPSAAILPDSRDLISQYLLLYSLSGEPGDFDGLVDYPYRNAIIQAFVKTDSSVFVADIDRTLLPAIKANFPDTVSVRLGGSVTTPTAMNEVMVAGKIMNIIQIVIVVFVATALVFRSLSLAGLILVPLIATIIAVFGVMGILGIPLQIATSTLAALAVGIGADYAIYFMWRLREELRQQTDETAALRAAYASAGKAVLFVASAVSGGYIVLMASLNFNIHIWLGLLTVVSMIFASISTLTLFVALLMIVRPKVVFGGPAMSKPLGAPSAAVALVVSACLGIALAAPGTHAVAQTTDAASLMAKSMLVTRPQRSQAVGRFVLTNSDGQKRVRQTTSISELKSDGIHTRRLVRFTSPADVSGTSVLTIENDGDDDIWVYLPALKKVRRLTASNKRDAFVGTDFSYGDILGHPVAEWTHRLVRSEVVDGVPSQVVESRPATPAVAANTGYSRRVNWISSTNGVVLKTEFYAPSGTLLKVYSGTDIRLVDPKARRYQPMRQVMKNVVTGHSTLIEYTSFRTDISISPDQFQPRSLERSF